MSLMKLVIHPDPRLRLKAAAVEKFDASLTSLVESMLATMYHHKGIGLAAPQVGVARRLFVVDVSENRNEAQVFINPEIKPGGENAGYEEGCLSIPGYYALINRPQNVRVRAKDRKGREFSIQAEGVLSTCIQHEYDHLEGGLFIDYLSQLKQSMVERKMEKYRREQEKNKENAHHANADGIN